MGLCLIMYLTINWHEAGHFPSPCHFWIRFCQLSFHRLFSNFFGGENWHESGWFDTLSSSLILIKGAPGSKDVHFSCSLSSCQLGLSNGWPVNKIKWSRYENKALKQLHTIYILNTYIWIFLQTNCWTRQFMSRFHLDQKARVGHPIVNSQTRNATCPGFFSQPVCFLSGLSWPSFDAAR